MFRPASCGMGDLSSWLVSRAGTQLNAFFVARLVAGKGIANTPWRKLGSALQREVSQGFCHFLWLSKI